ncbi:uncharacterized protein LOC134836318 [Culicoides brevitarsis]|uniref:uncharacterized protein LOC134836318 n=1 Tax=Culicoides brevitarsis TaxID=469753 RepID=UPI00307C40A8
MKNNGCKCGNMLKRCQDAKFFEAIYSSEVDKVKEFLEKEVNINVQNNDGYTAFHAACCVQNIEIIELLLDNGYMKVDTKVKTRVGDSALFLILTGYCEGISAKAVKKLVEYDRELVELADSRGFTPLQASSRWEQLDIVRILVELGKANVSRVDCDGWTALHHNADCRPNLAVMKYLIDEAGIDISVRNNLNMTAFDLLLHNHQDPILLPEDYIQCVDYLSDKYFVNERFYTFGTVLSLFSHAIVFERFDLVRKLIEDFYNEDVNSQFNVMKRFIATFEVDEIPIFYAFCMILNPRLREVTQFNYRQFTEVFPDVLHEALDSSVKLEVFLDCLGAIRQINSCSDKYIIPSIAEMEYNPLTVGDVRRLLKLYNCLMDLDYKVDFNSIAFGHFLSFLRSGCQWKLKHVEIVLAFCTDNFVRLTRYCDTFNMQLDAETRRLMYAADLPQEMKGPEYLPSLKEVARKVVRSSIYDALLAKGRKLGLPPDLYYKNKLFVENILALELPTVLTRYLRFMNNLPVE